MEKKNIAILIPSLADGGAERVASNLSIYLDEEKYNKYVIVYDDKNIDYDYRGELFSLKTKPTNNLFKKTYNFFKRIYKLKKIKKKYKIGTTISFLPNPNLVNIFSRYNDKVIISIRNYISKSLKGLKGKLYKFFIKLFYNKADFIVPVSKIIKKDLIDNYDINFKKIKVIYNPYDIEKINNMANKNVEKKFETIFSKPTIINMGRLTEQKGQWHLIRAFKKVKDEIQDAHLLILGEGELENYLMKLTDKLNITESVHFMGFRKNPFKYIANSDIFVLSSLFEGFPNALVEAMACKTSVISSDCPSGPREILAPDSAANKKANEIDFANYGVLVPVCNGKKYYSNRKITKEEKLLAESIIKMMKEKKLNKTYSEKSKIRAKDFRVNFVTKRWLKIIN